MSEFKFYQRKGLSEMRPYVPGEDLTGISVSDQDTPELGGMIARNPKNHADQWYVAKKYFEDNLELCAQAEAAPEKTFNNTTASQAKDNVKDIEFWGDGDTFKLISKASSKKEGWMKSTKAMEVADLGCVVQVTTQQGQNVAEAVVFVPGAQIETILDGDKVVGRKLVVNDITKAQIEFIKNS